MAEPIPEWIEKHYIVGPRLGGGNFSDVYHLTGRATPTTFAAKILKAEFRNNPSVRSRFQTEAKAMARLVHPNIVRIFDVGGAMSPEPAIVMEYCEGGDLRTYVKRRGLEPDQVAKLTLFLLLGLKAAHTAGVTHRGLCPESVFLDKALNPKLGDFGVALVAQNAHLPTQMGETVGEFLYMAPEQRHNAHHIDSRADIYAIGALLWFMLSRRDPPDLSLASRSPKIVDHIDPALRPIVVRACQARPDDRYQTAAEMGREIRKLFEER